MAKTFKFVEKHIHTWNTLTPEIAQLEDKLIALKNNEQWVRAYQYFSHLATKGIISERPTKANGYNIGCINPENGDFTYANYHLENFLKFKPEIMEIESRLDALKNKDWKQARQYFNLLGARGVLKNKPLKRNGYKLDLTLADAYINEPEREIIMENLEFFKGKGVRCTTDNKNFISCVEAGATYRVHPSYIGQACNGKVKEIRGKHFCWLEDKDTFVPQPKEAKRKCGPAPKKVLCITDGKEYESVKVTAAAYGIPQSCISDVCNGKLKKTHGMRFCFVSEMDKFAEEIAIAKANRKVKVKVRLIRKGVR